MDQAILNWSRIIRKSARKHPSRNAVIEKLQSQLFTYSNKQFSLTEIEEALEYLFDFYDPNRLAPRESFEDAHWRKIPFPNPFSTLTEIDTLGQVERLVVKDKSDMERVLKLLLYGERKELQVEAIDTLWKSLKTQQVDADNLPYFIYFAYITAVEGVERQAKLILRDHPLFKKIEKLFGKGADANLFLRALKTKLKVDIAPILELMLRHGHFLYDGDVWLKFCSYLEIPLQSIPSVFKLERISIDLSFEEKLNRYQEFQHFKNLRAISIYSYRRHPFPLKELPLPEGIEVLMGGRIKHFTKDVKEMKVSKLEFYLMNLQEIPAELFELEKLETLIIGDNPISKLPSLKETNNSLRTLAFIRNRLEFIPASFARLKHLQDLILMKNEFTTIPLLPIFEQLKCLNLSHNELTELPTNLSQLEQLEQLDLYNNNLADISDDLVKLSRLKILDLRFNPIDPRRIEWLQAQMPKTEIRYY